VIAADWRSLIETFLSDELDAETFRDDFLEAWRTAHEEKSKIPDVVEDLYVAVEAFATDDAEADVELRDAAESALEHLKK
jgi:hypothetical protein